MGRGRSGKGGCEACKGSGVGGRKDEGGYGGQAAGRLAIAAPKLPAGGRADTKSLPILKRIRLDASFFGFNFATDVLVAGCMRSAAARGDSSNSRHSKSKMGCFGGGCG